MTSSPGVVTTSPCRVLRLLVTRSPCDDISRNPLLVRVSVCVCVCPCLFLHDNSKRNRSMNTKFEYIVVYENSSDEFDIEFPRINFLDHELYISALEHVMKLILCSYVLLVFINRICKHYYA